MKNLDPVELVKNSAKSNSEDWLKETSIVSYGVVTAVVAKNIVKVEQLVRNGIAKKIVTVVLVSSKSSLFEAGADPAQGDLVKLTFLDKYNRAMFDNAIQRYNDTGDWGIQDTDAVGYNKSAAVGELIGPYEGLAETIVQHYLDDAGVPSLLLRSRAKLTTIMRREIDVLFDSLPSSGGLLDRAVKLKFGQNSPHTVEHWAAVTRKHGFAVKADLSLETVTAPVVEEYSTMAPITKGIQGTQTITIGKGTNPAGDPSGSPVDTHAPVSLTFGADADITLTSESGATIHFDKPFTLTCAKKISINGQDAIEMLAGTAMLSKFGNNIGTLGPLIDEFVNAITTAPLVAVTGAAGGPSLINPAITALFATFKTKWDQVFN